MTIPQHREYIGNLDPATYVGLKPQVLSLVFLIHLSECISSLPWKTSWLLVRHVTSQYYLTNLLIMLSEKIQVQTIS